MLRPDFRRVWVTGWLVGLFGFTNVCDAQAAARPGNTGAEGGTAETPHDPSMREVSTDEPLPAGHPAIDDSDANPHSHAGNASAMDGVFEPPKDDETPDPSLPPGSIAIDLRDADDHPVPNEVVTLGILINSIAKGDSRKHMQATTDGRGHASFANLETAGNIAYRVSSGYEGGSFAAPPFQLGQTAAMHVVLHVYHVTRDINATLIVCEATVAAELRDDRIQIEEAFVFYNLGRVAWQPADVRMGLPEGFTAFNAQASMSDQGVDDAGGSAKLRGTFAPGRHPVEFRWQLPWSGDRDVDFDVGLPPHVAIARVMMPATSTVKLAAVDFPAAEVRRDEQGQSFLVTERRLRPNDAKLASVSLGIHDLPTPGPGRLVASLLAACCVAVGLTLARPSRPRSRRLLDSNRTLSREGLLVDLAELERARSSGEVGPRTYERTRRELIAALARSLAGPI